MNSRPPTPGFLGLHTFRRINTFAIQIRPVLKKITFFKVENLKGSEYACEYVCLWVIMSEYTRICMNILTFA